MFFQNLIFVFWNFLPPYYHIGTMSTSESSSRPVRERKATERLAPEVREGPREVSVPAGTGVQLANYPFFLQNFEKYKTDDDICKQLHMIMFNSVGTKNDRKKNIRKFCGFEDSGSDERLSRLIDRKAATVQILKVCSFY